MKIASPIYTNIMQLHTTVPPEHGGILGGYSDVITEYFHDYSVQDLNFATYIPNIAEFNRQILHWHKNNIDFYGMLHSHPSYEKELSLNDKEYIYQIMYSLSQKNATLYFPIVLPYNEMLVFVAKKDRDMLTIERDILELI